MATSYRDSVGEPEGTVAIDGTREKKKKKMSERRDKGKGEDAGQKKATVSVDELLPKVERKLGRGLLKAQSMDQLCKGVGLPRSKAFKSELLERVCGLNGVARAKPEKGAASASKFYRVSNALLEAALAQVPSEETAQVIGEFIYPYIEHWYQDAAPKLTGMLLEMSVCDLLHLTEDLVALNSKLDEALTVLIKAGKVPESMRPPKRQQQQQHFAESQQTNVSWSGMVGGGVSESSKPDQQEDAAAQEGGNRKNPWNNNSRTNLNVEATPFVHISGDWPSLPTESAEEIELEREQAYAEDDYEYESDGGVPEGRMILGGDDMLGEGFEDMNADLEGSFEYYDEEEEEEDDEERDRLLDMLQSQAKRETVKEASKIAKVPTHIKRQANIRVKEKKEEPEGEPEGEPEVQSEVQSEQDQEDLSSNINSLLEELNSMSKPSS